MSEYDEDLKKACEILNNTELDELLQVAVEAMDDAATDIGMEASQEWHAKITLESALIHIAEKVAKRPSLTIPKSIAEKTVGYFDKDRPNYFERSTRFVFSNWSSDLNGDNFDDSEFNKRIQIVGAYLNPLTRDLVKVEDVAE